eukprot:TRINITY_DN4767_c0_g1_i3.p2 TRINITY_DN4767_c0_g1~~TRINITY_DN4767_c0_g1_i3.p2  ORF type:complete len:110 (+),score=25.95 TRINITY_DN4767_c0_g1_i3:204-533(+)
MEFLQKQQEEMKKMKEIKVSGLTDFLIKKEKMLLPIIMHTIKQAKIKPYGMLVFFGKESIIAGLHMNTNVYIDASNNDCINPSTIIFLSLDKETMALEKVAITSIFESP